MKTIFSDVNMFVNSNTKGTVLKNIDVINQSFYNILTTPIGVRYRQPKYGSNLPFLLQQPLDSSTIFAAKTYATQAIKQWEPRVVLIEEDIIFQQTQPDGITGVIPYYVPQFNVTGTFSAVFIRD